MLLLLLWLIGSYVPIWNVGWCDEQVLRKKFCQSNTNNNQNNSLRIQGLSFGSVEGIDRTSGWNARLPTTLVLIENSQLYSIAILDTIAANYRMNFDQDIRHRANIWQQLNTMAWSTMELVRKKFDFIPRYELELIDCRFRVLKAAEKQFIDLAVRNKRDTKADNTFYHDKNMKNLTLTIRAEIALLPKKEAATKMSTVDDLRRGWPSTIGDRYAIRSITFDRDDRGNIFFETNNIPLANSDAKSRRYLHQIALKDAKKGGHQIEQLAANEIGPNFSPLIRDLPVHGFVVTAARSVSSSATVVHVWNATERQVYIFNFPDDDDGQRVGHSPLQIVPFKDYFECKMSSTGNGGDHGKGFNQNGAGSGGGNKGWNDKSKSEKEKKRSKYYEWIPAIIGIVMLLLLIGIVMLIIERMRKSADSRITETKMPRKKRKKFPETKSSGTYYSSSSSTAMPSRSSKTFSSTSTSTSATTSAKTPKSYERYNRYYNNNDHINRKQMMISRVSDERNISPGNLIQSTQPFSVASNANGFASSNSKLCSAYGSTTIPHRSKIQGMNKNDDNHRFAIPLSDPFVSRAITNIRIPTKNNNNNNNSKVDNNKVSPPKRGAGAAKSAANKIDDKNRKKKNYRK